MADHGTQKLLGMTSSKWKITLFLQVKHRTILAMVSIAMLKYQRVCSLLKSHILCFCTFFSLTA